MVTSDRTEPDENSPPRSATCCCIPFRSLEKAINKHGYRSSIDKGPQVPMSVKTKYEPKCLVINQKNRESVTPAYT
uniref:Uncharacterized protein n=1 Tax=Romanomermis culicivorax TaxID=13658 RepID=A0A915I2L6_ROMCU